MRWRPHARCPVGEIGPQLARQVEVAKERTVATLSRMASQYRSTARTVRRQVFSRGRVVLAAKTAVAAAVAWYFAP